MHREGALHADAEGHLADGEGLTHTATLAADHDALEDLDALFGALDHLDVNVNGVAGGEVGQVVAEGLLVEEVQGVHIGCPIWRVRE